MVAKRLFIALFLIVFSSAGYAQQKAETADNIFSRACKEAADQNKNVFILFHASWCVWCHRMDSAIYHPSISKYFTDNYIITHLVVHEGEGKEHLNNPGALEMINKYKGYNQGIPFWLIFDKKGNLLADSHFKTPAGNAPEEGMNIGCPSRKEEVNYFITVLKNTSPLQPEQLLKIAEKFLETGQH